MIHLLLLLSFIVLTSYQVSFFRGRKRLAVTPWDEITGKLNPVDLQLMSSLAARIEAGAITEQKFPESVYVLIGGRDGLRRMERNARTMLELAVYAERWSDDYGESFSEAMRHEGLLLKAAIMRIQIARVTRRSVSNYAISVHQVVVGYCRMRKCLFDMYAVVHQGKVPELQGVL